MRTMLRFRHPTHHSSAMHHFLDRSTIVNRWDNTTPNRIQIESGDSLQIEMRDSSDAQVHPGMDSAAFSKIDTLRIHAMTGPIGVAGAEPGDVLAIDIHEYQLEGWAWTSIIPGLGLLDKDFETHFLHIWELEEDRTRSMPGLTIPLAPFCGIIGVQPATPGTFRTRPPGNHGGNMDVRHLTAGSTLYLPVQVPEAGLCVGDAHAAQGDGEVSINGMEAPMQVKLRVKLLKNTPLPGPTVFCPTPLEPDSFITKPHHIWIESDEDIRIAAQRVVRRAIAYLVERLGISAEQAYVTCSVLLRLKLSQMVNVPITTVSGYLPEAVFDEPCNKLILT